MFFFVSFLFDQWEIPPSVRVVKNEKITNEKEQNKNDSLQDDDKQHDNNKTQRVNQTQQLPTTKVDTKLKQTQPTTLTHTKAHNNVLFSDFSGDVRFNPNKNSPKRRRN